MNSKILKLSDLASYYQFAAVLFLSLLTPFLVHFIPSPTALPVGAYLIPLFFIPTAAVFMFNRWSISLAAASAPFIYGLINGFPAFEVSFVLAAELFLFTHILATLKSTGKLGYTAPLVSILSVKVILGLSMLLLPVSTYANPVVDYLFMTTLFALPGIILLHGIYYYMNKSNN